MRQGQKTRWHRSWSQLSRLRCFFLLQCASTRPDAVSRLVPIDRTSDDLHDRLPKTPHAATPHQDPTTHKRRKKRKKKKTRSDYNAPDWLRPWLLLPVFFFFLLYFSSSTPGFPSHGGMHGNGAICNVLQARSLAPSATRLRQSHTCFYPSVSFSGGRHRLLSHTKQITLCALVHTLPRASHTQYNMQKFGPATPPLVSSRVPGPGPRLFTTALSGRGEEVTQLDA